MKPTTEATGTLFDLQPYCKEDACKNCGQEYSPSHKRQLFCCPKCKRAFFNRTTERLMHARFQLIQDFDLPSPKLSQKDKEAVELYTKKKRGIKSIAWWQGRKHVVVRRALIRAGVYRPDPKHNGTAKTGTGAASRILRRQRMEQRENEWRHRIAVCLWNLRRGQAVEATCHSHGWRPPSVWNHVGKNGTYRKWKAAHPAKAQSVQD